MKKCIVRINTSYTSAVVVAYDSFNNCLAIASTLSSGDTSYNVAKKVARVLQKLGITNIEVVVKGLGENRVQVLRTLIDYGFNIEIIRDVTPIPHNGCRPPRRLKKRY